MIAHPLKRLSHTIVVACRNSQTILADYRARSSPSGITCRNFLRRLYFARPSCHSQPRQRWHYAAPVGAPECPWDRADNVRGRHKLVCGASAPFDRRCRRCKHQQLHQQKILHDEAHHLTDSMLCQYDHIPTSNFAAPQTCGERSSDFKSADGLVRRCMMKAFCLVQLLPLQCLRLSSEAAPKHWFFKVVETPRASSLDTLVLSLQDEATDDGAVSTAIGKMKHVMPLWFYSI